MGTLRAVAKVPGGAVNPGKAVSGLAEAAAKAGVQIVEHVAVESIEFQEPLRLRLRRLNRQRVERQTVSAEHVLLATNAGSLDLGDSLITGRAEPKLTFALATTRITKQRLAAIGMKSKRPFYTVDFPYLWGRLLPDRRLIFGSGLMPGFGESLRMESRRKKAAKFNPRKLWKGLERIDVRRGVAAQRLASLERRVRGLHAALTKIRVTHRWGGPILLTDGFRPVFRKHPKSDRVIVAGGYSGHGVALSVYLGNWAAEHLLGRRELPNWPLR